ncbi:MAG: YfbR-like 5'-deoxynucleotidase [Dehalococcoidales bacterium]
MSFWIETYTGLAFSIVDPRPDDVRLVDIAHALSNTCRYNGHCKRFYSVAEHSVHLARFIRYRIYNTRAVALAALLHDAAEAYTGDFPTPFKWALPELKYIENAIQQAVHDHYCIKPEDYKVQVIDDLDKRIVKDERKALMTESGLPWGAIDGLEPLDINIECWKPEIAEDRFLATFHMLACEEKAT